MKNKIKIALYSLLLFLLIILAYNLSSWHIPPDKILYDQSKNYFLETEQQFGLARYQENDIGIGMSSYSNDIILLNDVQPAFDLLISEMTKAENNINLEVYIIHDDQTGKLFKSVLIEKAKQGLEIRLIYDAWGSALTPKSYFNDLRNNGVKVTAYNPILTSIFKGRLFNRLHRKMIIIDGKKAFIGGENIGDEYLGKNSKIKFWKDTGIFFIGNAANSVQQIFLNDWLQSRNEKVLDKSFYPNTSDDGNNNVKIVPGDPNSPLTNISLSYINLINRAEKELLLISPYFLPNSAFLNALYQASERNVDIHLVLPSKNDNILARITKPYYIRELLNHGIKVSTYNRDFIHSKIIIVDDNIASVGTANFDRLSLNKNYEVISVIYDQDTIQQLKSDFLNVLKDSSTHFPNKS